MYFSYPWDPLCIYRFIHRDAEPCSRGSYNLNWPEQVMAADFKIKITFKNPLFNVSLLWTVTFRFMLFLCVTFVMFSWFLFYDLIHLEPCKALCSCVLKRCYKNTLLWTRCMVMMWWQERASRGQHEAAIMSSASVWRLKYTSMRKNLVRWFSPVLYQITDLKYWVSIWVVSSFVPCCR